MGPRLICEHDIVVIVVIVGDNVFVLFCLPCTHVTNDHFILLLSLFATSNGKYKCKMDFRLLCEFFDLCQIGSMNINAGTCTKTHPRHLYVNVWNDIHLNQVPNELRPTIN